MPRPFRFRAGVARRRRVPIALATAAVMVVGVGQPLLTSAQAEYNPVAPLTDLLDGNVKNVQESLAAAQTLASALTENVQQFADNVGTIAAGLPADPSTALTALQGAATAEVASLLPLGLTTAVQLVSKISTPTCASLASLTQILDPVAGLLANAQPLAYSVLGPLGDVARQLDQRTSDALLAYYNNTLTKLLTPSTTPAGGAGAYVALVQTLLGALKVTYRTTLDTPGGPVTRDTVGILGLPTLIDVDRSTGQDICATTTLDLATLQLKQSITRLPLSNPKLPLKIEARLLEGAAAPGYDARASKAPTSFESITDLVGNVAHTKLIAPGATFDQFTNLLDTIEFRGASVKPPALYNYGVSTPPGGNGTRVDYNGGVRSDKFRWSASVLVDTTSYTMGIAQSPGATSFSYCTSAIGSCSNEADAAKATEKGSLSFTASEVVNVDQNYFANIGGTISQSPAAPACSAATLTVLPLPAPAPSIASVDARLTGKSLVVAGDGGVAVGHAYIDTAGAPVSGCFATAGMTGTLPTGFSATGRSASWQATLFLGALINPVSTAKSGSITCPNPVADTKIAGGTLGTFNSYARFLCSFPATPGTVTVTAANGYTVGKTLQPNKGTWGPAAPNAPTITYTWQRCTTAGACTDIPGKVDLADTAAARNYVITAADQGHTLRVIVKGTNADGAVTATSANTPVITS